MPPKSIVFRKRAAYCRSRALVRVMRSERPWWARCSSSSQAGRCTNVLLAMVIFKDRLDSPPEPIRKSSLATPSPTSWCHPISALDWPPCAADQEPIGVTLGGDTRRAVNLARSARRKEGVPIVDQGSG
jgi:hypothetical protein